MCPVLSRQGQARQGQAKPGEARRIEARPGEFRRGKANGEDSCAIAMLPKRLQCQVASTPKMQREATNEVPNERGRWEWRWKWRRNGYRGRHMERDGSQ